MYDARSVQGPYIFYFIGTVLVWLAIFLVTFIILGGTPYLTGEIITVIVGGAISSVVGGAAWFVWVAEEPSPEGSGLLTDMQMSAHERSHRATLIYFAGSALMGTSVLVATAIELRGSPYLLPQVLLVFLGGVVWFAVLVPVALFHHRRTPRPTPPAME